MGISQYLKTASYLVRGTPYRLEKPIVLQMPVTDICNSRCQMCRIWKNDKSDEITPEDVRRALRNPLFTEVTAVGLNGGEPTLRKDLAELAGALFDVLPRLRNVSLITNGLQSSDVIARIGEVGAIVQENGGRLDVMVSLDGRGELHDRVRGRPGAFERAERVLDHVTTSPLVHTVRVGCTIVRDNVYGLADLFEYCHGRGTYIKYRLGIPHRRLYAEHLVEPYALTAEDKYHVAEFLEGLIAHYETNELQRYFYRSLVDQLLHGAPRKAGCDWRHRGATITARGELMYCAVQSRTIGAIAERDIEEKYFASESHLREILERKCASCAHDYGGLPPRDVLARMYLARALRRVRADSWARKLHRATPLSQLIRRRRFTARRARLDRLGTGTGPASRVSQTDVRRVLICGWYGTETLGDKAILAGVVEAVRAALGPVECTLASLHPYVSEMTRRQMCELKDIRIVPTHRAMELAGKSDLVAMGGGPLMAIEELAEMEAVFGAARRRGVPTLIAGCGVGPLGDSWHNDSLRRLLSGASTRIYRDRRSLQLAAKLGVDTSRDAVAEDPAFTWLSAQRGRLKVRPPDDRKVLLLGLREFEHGQYARHVSRRDCEAAGVRYERAVIAALELRASRHSDLVIRPLPMCTNHFGGDDRWFYRRLFRRNQALAGRLDLEWMGAELAPAEYCEAFAGAHVALAMRFHALVFALALHVPAVALDYTLGQGKVNALARRFGVPVQSLADLETAFIVDQVEAFLSKRVGQAAGFTPSFQDELKKSLGCATSAGSLGVRAG